MGFFRSLFGRDWQGYKKKADAYLANKEWGRARGSYLEAKSKLDDDAPQEVRQSIEEGLSKANGALLEMHMTEGQRYFKQEMYDKAMDHLQTALDFVDEGNGAKRAELMALVRQVQERAAAPPPIEPQQVAPEQPTAQLTDDEIFITLLNMLPPQQADVYAMFPEAFKHAYLAMNDREWDKAEGLLLPVVEQSPDNIYLQFELARLRLNQGKFEEAEGLLANVSDQAPDMLVARHARVEALCALKRWEKAERVVEEAFEIDDEALVNFALAGHTCLRSGEYDNGVELVEAGLELHPKSIGLHRLLGQLHLARENTSSAIEHFETAVGLGWSYNHDTGKLTFDADSAFLAANLYLTTRTNLARGEELFRALVHAGGPQPALLVGLGQALLFQKKNQEARQVLMDALRVMPEGSEEAQKVEELLGQT